MDLGIKKMTGDRASSKKEFDKRHFICTVKQLSEEQGTSAPRQSLRFDPIFKRVFQERKARGSIHDIYKRGEGFFPLNRAFKSLVYENKNLTAAERDLILFLLLSVSPASCVLAKGTGEIAREMGKPMTKISTSLRRLAREKLAIKIKLGQNRHGFMLHPGLIKHRDKRVQIRLENKFNSLVFD